MAEQEPLLWKDRPVPPQPPGAWLPFGQLPGADTVYNYLVWPPLEVFVAALVILSIATFAIETLPAERQYFGALDVFEDATAVLFAIEYFARWWSRSLRPSYLLKPLMVIDLLSFLPTLLSSFGPGVDLSAFIPGLRSGAGSLTFLRALRILRLNRFVRDEETFSTLRNAYKFGSEPVANPPATDDRRRPLAFDLQIARVVTSLSSLIVVTAGFLYETEEAQVPDFFTAIFDAVTTLTTVGSFTPQTPAGRFIVCIAILFGIAVVPLQLSRLAESAALADLPDADEGSAEGGNGGEPAGPLIVDSTCVCEACGASGHWIGASFCFSCGQPLRRT